MDGVAQQESIQRSARRRRPSQTRRWVSTVLLTLLAHGLLFILMLAASALSPRPTDARRGSSRPVTLRPLTSNRWTQNRTPRQPGVRETAETPPLAQKKETPKEEQPKGQVVDVQPGNNQKAPDAKYLAEHDNQVKQESRARETSPAYRNAMPNRTSSTPEAGHGKDAAAQKQETGNRGAGQDDRPVRQAGDKQRVMEVPDVKARQQVAMRDIANPGPGAKVSNRSESAAIRGNAERLRLQQGRESGEAEEASQGRAGTPGDINLSPSASTLAKVSGAAPNDHLADVDEGDGTFLNTKEWKYSTFFNRVKQAVGMHWDPGTELRRRDPTFNIYSGRDRYTLLNVVLNERGLVKEIKVEKSSGIDFLDSEAIASFERSQPFPNPPPGLVGTDKTVHFQFGFFLEMGGGPKLRLFRPN